MGACTVQVTSIGCAALIALMLCSCDKGEDTASRSQGSASREELEAAYRKREQGIAAIHSKEIKRRLDSAQRAADLFARHAKAPTDAAIRASLQSALDQQCKEDELEPVLVADLETYNGAAPDSVWCDGIDASAIVYRFNRKSRTWVQK